MTLFRSVFFHVVLFVSFASVLIVGTILGIEAGSIFASWLNKMPNIGLSTGLWAHYFWMYSSFFAVVALLALLLIPSNARAILFTYNFSAFVTLFWVFWNTDHEAWFWGAFLGAMFISNVTLYLAKVLSDMANAGPSRL